MAKLEIVLKELESLNRDEILVVWEFLQQKIKSLILNPVKSVESESLQFNDFSFSKTRKILDGKKINLSETIIQERRSYE